MASPHLRILKAGLAAGVVSIVSGMAMVPVVGPQMNSALAARGLPALRPGAMLYFALHSLAIGLVMVWLYAALQASRGRGPRTVLLVATLVWFLAYFGVNAAMVAYGFLPLTLSVVGTGWGWVELWLGATVGVHLYEGE